MANSPSFFLLFLFWLAAGLFVGDARAAPADNPEASGSADASSSPKATKTSSSSAATHSVSVGAAGFKFDPNTTVAQVGDIVEFRFYPGGHSVVRSDFKKACIPYELTGINRKGFFSGFQNPQVYTNDGPSFQVKINDTDPVFFYCSAPGSCVDHHMIGVINPNSSWTLAIQEEYAEKAEFQLNPGEPLPVESAKPSETSSSNSGSGNDNTSNSGLGGGPIAGIVIGAVAVLVAAGALIFFFGRHSRRKQQQQQQQQGNNPAMTSPLPMADNKYHPQSPGQNSMANNYVGPGPHGTDLYQFSAQQHYPQDKYNADALPGYQNNGAVHHLHPSAMDGGSFGDPSQRQGSPYSSPPPRSVPSSPPIELPGSLSPRGPAVEAASSDRNFSHGVGGDEQKYRPGGI